MTVLTLALSLSGAALNAANSSDYRLEKNNAVRPYADPESEESVSPRRWTLGAHGWIRGRSGCRTLIESPLGTDSVFRFGPRCDDDEVPYGRPLDHRAD